jgi:hypothetical protein
VIKFVGGILRALWFSPPNIVESGFKHHKTNQPTFIIDLKRVSIQLLLATIVTM